MKTLQILALIPFGVFAQNETLTPPEKLFSEIHWNAQSPVKNQGERNSCSAFGVAAALETFDGVPKDLSEKYLYAIQKLNDFTANKKTSKGQFLASYPNALIANGVVTEAELPYDSRMTEKWYKTDSEFSQAFGESEIGFMDLLKNYSPKAKVFLNEYEFLDVKASKNVEYIKLLLKSGIKAIPVTYQLYIPGWKGQRTTNFNTITPDFGYTLFGITGNKMTYSDAKNIYGNSINEKILSGELKFVNTDPDLTQYRTHVVTIIGYDDQGFIIKNSWGSTWRWNGYERVSFDFHKLFVGEALVIKSVTIKN